MPSSSAGTSSRRASPGASRSPPRDVIRELGDTFGTQFLTQPSEPMFLVDPRGVPHLLPFGRKSADALRSAVQQYR